MPGQVLAGGSQPRKGVFRLRAGEKIFMTVAMKSAGTGWVCPVPGTKASTKGEHYENLLIGAAQPVAGGRLYRSFELWRGRTDGEPARRGTCCRTTASAGFADDRPPRQRSGAKIGAGCGSASRGCTRQA